MWFSHSISALGAVLIMTHWTSVPICSGEVVVWLWWRLHGNDEVCGTKATKIFEIVRPNLGLHFYVGILYILKLGRQNIFVQFWLRVVLQFGLRLSMCGSLFVACFGGGTLHLGGCTLLRW